MGSGYWSGVCSAAVNRPINEKNMITNGLSGVLLALYCITAIASIFRLVQFSLLNSEQRTMVWIYFGKFNALLTAASVAGAVAWASFAQNTITISSTYSTIFNNTLATGNFEQISASKRQVAQANLWSAFFFSFSAFEFAMISIAQILVLDRLRMFISRTQPSFQAATVQENLACVSCDGGRREHNCSERQHRVGVPLWRVKCAVLVCCGQLCCW